MQSLQTIVVACLLASLAACTSSPAELVSHGDSVKVLDAIKGDELVVAKDGKRVTVRMLGIHAFGKIEYDPALAALGEASKSHLIDPLRGEYVTVNFGRTRKDIHDRYLVYVIKDGVDLNRALVDSGYAVVYTEYAFNREAAYLEAEKKARAAKKQMWANADAVALVRSLRGLWAETRKQKGEPVVGDELLIDAAAPTNVPAEPPSDSPAEPPIP